MARKQIRWICTSVCFTFFSRKRVYLIYMGIMGSLLCSFFSFQKLFASLFLFLFLCKIDIKMVKYIFVCLSELSSVDTW